MDAVLKALADESHRTVLKVLRDHPATAGELADALPIAPPGASRHLRVLRRGGPRGGEPGAQRRIYTLRFEALLEVDDWHQHCADASPPGRARRRRRRKAW